MIEEQIYKHINPVQPTSSKIRFCIVSSFDDKYAKYYATLLESIKINKKINVDLIVFSDKISQENIDVLNDIALSSSISLRFYDISDLILDFFGDLNDKSTVWPPNIFFRLLIPVVISDKYDRALYLDTDTLTLSGFDEIFETNLRNKPLGAVQDFIINSLDRFNDILEHIKSLHLKNNQNYFNSGVLIFDLKNKIPIKHYINEIKHILETSSLKFPDQDILNIIFNDKVEILDPTFNLQVGFFNALKYHGLNIPSALENTINNRKVIHYTQIRPWENSTIQLAQAWWIYLSYSPYSSIITAEYSINKSNRNLKLYSCRHILRLKYIIHLLMAKFSPRAIPKMEKYHQLLIQALKIKTKFSMFN